MPTPFFEDPGFTLYHGDCVDVLPTLDPVDAVVTDPPYGLKFMGKSWDHGVPSAAVWRAVLDSMKPGAHLLAFGGTRTHHRLMVAIEDAGFELRDVIMWVYGSGFPKSLDVSKAIDRQRDDQSEILQVTAWIASAVKRSGLTHAQILNVFGFNKGSGTVGHWTATVLGSQPAVPTLDQIPKLLNALGVTDPPAEIARLLWTLNSSKGKPGPNWWKRGVVGHSDATAATGAVYGGYAKGFDLTTSATDAAKQWDGWGTGLKPSWEPIIVARKPLDGTVAANVLQHGVGGLNIDACRVPLDDERVPTGSGDRRNMITHAQDPWTKTHEHPGNTTPPGGRWPANLIHDGSDEVTALFPSARSAGHYPSSSRARDGVTGFAGLTQGTLHADSGSAARFFYCAKASPEDRGEGNNHPTVKPTDLMRYLVRLVTPRGGTVLDPFMGSGSTGKAADLEGLAFIGIDTDLVSCETAARRRDPQLRLGVGGD